jgi:hypothetical protein
MFETETARYLIAIPLLYAGGKTLYCPCDRINSCHKLEFWSAVGFAVLIQCLHLWA